MGLTPSDLRTAALADSHTFARMKGRIAYLRRKGRVREAVELRNDYEARKRRWIELINALEGEKELR